MASQMNSTKHLERNYYLSFQKYSKKLKKEHFQTYSNKASITQIPKPKTLYNKGEVQANIPMNRDAKILNNILAKWIQISIVYNSRSYTMDIYTGDARMA